MYGCFRLFKNKHHCVTLINNLCKHATNNSLYQCCIQRLKLCQNVHNDLEKTLVRLGMLY